MKPFNKIITITESFLGGIFGGSAKVPWEGKEFKDNQEHVGTQIATDLSGSESFIVSGGNLHSVSGNNDSEVKKVINRINTYRGMQYYTEVDEALEHIINDVVTSDAGKSPISLDLDRLKEKLPENVLEKLVTAHEKICKKLDLEENAYEIFRQFFIDGKRGYQVILNTVPTRGIEKIVALDSRFIRPVKLLEIEQNSSGVEFIKSERRTYLYDSTASNQQGVTSWLVGPNQSRIIELPFESVAYGDSGMFTVDGRSIVGFLEPAVKPANNLKTVEDATVIYAFTRAVDKRAFYLDVGDLPKKSAEEYMVSMMNKFKTKLNYDSATGEVDRNKAAISMVEDLWLPRKDGVSATEIQTLEAGKNLGEINHVEYFKGKLYHSLKIPNSRRSGESTLNFGGSELAQITRDEWKFGKYISRIRKRFNPILKHCLKVECLQTKIMSEKEWEEFEQFISYEYEGDSYIKEQQETEIMMGRVSVLNQIEGFVGKLYSIETVRRDVLKMSDEEAKLEDEKIANEISEGKYKNSGPESVLRYAAESSEEI